MADLKTYTGTTALAAVIIAVQIVAARGSLALILLLSLVNAILIAAFSMGLKDEPGKAVALILLTPLLVAMVFALGMITS